MTCSTKPSWDTGLLPSSPVLFPAELWYLCFLSSCEVKLYSSFLWLSKGNFLFPEKFFMLGRGYLLVKLWLIYLALLSWQLLFSLNTPWAEINLKKQIILSTGLILPKRNYSRWLSLKNNTNNLNDDLISFDGNIYFLLRLKLDRFFCYKVLNVLSADLLQYVILSFQE